MIFDEIFNVLFAASEIYFSQFQNHGLNFSKIHRRKLIIIFSKMQQENQITPELLASEDNLDSFELDINAVFAF